MTGQGLYWGVTVGVPVAPRCTPLVTAASGADLARAVAGGLDLLHPLFPHTRPPLRVSLPQDGRGGEWLSRRVGELVS
jgi:hypothetical protein